MTTQINHVEAFFDLRSPYSFLAIGPARELSERSGVKFDWWPYVTDFQSAYGGEVEQRSSRDVAKLKYLYMDCRRIAKLQGLTVRSTTKLWNPTLASQAILFAKSKNLLWEFCDPMLTAFWKREFDLESSNEVESALVNAGMSVSEWRAFVDEKADTALNDVLKHAEELGVFGAPTFIFRNEMFWGGDRMHLLESAILREIV